MAAEPRLSSEDIASVAAGLAAAVLGAVLMLDDYKDFEKLGVERDPPLPHHGMLGVLMLIGGLAGLSVALTDLITKNI